MKVGAGGWAEDGGWTGGQLPRLLRKRVSSKGRSALRCTLGLAKLCCDPTGILFLSGIALSSQCTCSTPAGSAQAKQRYHPSHRQGCPVEGAGVVGAGHKEAPAQLGVREWESCAGGAPHMRRPGWESRPQRTAKRAGKG